MDRKNNRVRKVTASTNIISTYIGGGSLGDDDVAATSASLSEPCYGRVDSSYNFYLTEYVGAKVRKVVQITDTPTSIPRYSFLISLYAFIVT